MKYSLPVCWWRIFWHNRHCVIKDQCIVDWLYRIKALVNSKSGSKTLQQKIDNNSNQKKKINPFHVKLTNDVYGGWMDLFFASSKDKTFPPDEI